MKVTGPLSRRFELRGGLMSEVVNGTVVRRETGAHSVDLDWPFLPENREIPAPLDPTIPPGGEAPRAVLAERRDDIGPEH